MDRPRAARRSRAAERLVPIAALLGVLALPGALAGCKTTGARAGNAAAAVGQPAPDFTLHTVGDDRPIQLSSLRGKPVLVNFMCNCHYCFELAHAWDKNRGKTGTAQMLAIMHNRETFNPVNVRHFREATHFDVPILADLNSKTALQYRSTDCPQVWVIDRDGVIRWHNNDRTDPADTIVKGALDALKALGTSG